MLSVQEHYSFPDGFPSYLIVLAVLAAAGGWAALHILKLRAGKPAGKVLLFASKWAAGLITILLAAQLAMRWLSLTTNWPMWTLAAAGALAIECIIHLYSLERRIVSRRAGGVLAALRGLLVLLVIAMLAQPVLSLDLTDELRRTVAILIDDSGSMHVGDVQMTGAEKARLADLLPGDQGPRRYRLEEVKFAIEKTRDGLQSRLERLSDVADVTGLSARQKGLERIREDLRDAAADARKTLEQQSSVIGEMLEKGAADAQTKKQLTDVKERLSRHVPDRLTELAAMTEPRETASLGRNYDQLRAILAGVVKDLTEQADALGPLAKAADEQFYAALASEAKARLDKLASQERFNLARHLLLGTSLKADGKQDPNFVERLRSMGYQVKTYTFARQLQQFDFDAWQKDYAGIDSPPPDADAFEPDRQQTNAGKALEDLAAGAADVGRLTAVVIFTDGRFSDGSVAQQAAARLGSQKTPVRTVLFGSSVPPRDAAVISVDTPGVVYEGDKVHFKINAKVDGLAGQTGRVTVRRVSADGKQKDAKPIVSDFKVPANMNSFDLQVELADEETTKAGLYEYVVEVTAGDGKPWKDEVRTENNTHNLAVNVSDDRTKVLLVESRPRWEFRYLKNLFSDRDPTVQLQYVLLESDAIEGIARDKQIAASAARPHGEVEATALPGHAAEKLSAEDFVKEWLKFDLVILGDVGREKLSAQDLQALEKFVNERGGTLVVIAGPRYMPHTFAGSPLEHLLPVTFAAKTGYVRAAGSAASDRPYEGFRIALTDEGRRHVLTRQLDDAEANNRLWQDMPAMYWRYPIEQAKPAATVLAYAVEPGDKQPSPGGGGKTDADELQRHRAFQRQRALITARRYGKGQVLFMSFDRTWRFRYRIGDTYHHRFWGQVLRWATGEKLPSGTRLVRIGTDKILYDPQEKVMLAAKILDMDFDPLNEKDSRQVEAKIFKDDKQVRQAKLTPVSGPLGRFEADLGELGIKYGEGDYRAELHSPAVKAILSAEGKQNVVSVRFRVADKVPDEQKYLACDPAVPQELARASNGSVTAPHELPALADAFGAGVQTQVEHRQYTVWDSWVVLMLIVAAATAEWILRKRVGLV